MKTLCWMFSCKFVTIIEQLTAAFISRSFDKTNTGPISEAHFRKIMRSKESVDEEDINEMIEGEKYKAFISIFPYFVFHCWKINFNMQRAQETFQDIFRYIYSYLEYKRMQQVDGVSSQNVVEPFIIYKGKGLFNYDISIFCSFQDNF